MLADLLPLSAYTSGASSRRTTLVMAALWGTPITLLLVFSDSGLSPIAALAVGVGAALLFGTLWTRWFGRSMRQLIERLHRADPNLVPDPPAGDYRVRVLGNLMTSPAFGVGGHLYAGPEHLAFVPHAQNRAADRATRVLRAADIRRVEIITRPAPAVARLLSPKPLTYVRVAGADQDWLLRVPEPVRVAAAVERMTGYIASAG